ncbi:MAG: hypothetical protein H8E48_10975 [Chloroflexi bacterium]|nr:hypothetical protein [Chloroflexota bacterium]
MDADFMNDGEFLEKIREKIERLTGREVELHINDDDASQLGVEMDGELPLVILGNHALEYTGFARMGIEYAVACIREERPIQPIEFHMLLARN